MFGECMSQFSSGGTEYYVLKVSVMGELPFMKHRSISHIGYEFHCAWGRTAKCGAVLWS